MSLHPFSRKGQDSPKASPRAIIKWKNLIEQLKLLLEWMLYERWRRLSIQSSTSPTCGQYCSLSAAQRQTAPIAEGRQHPLFRTKLIFPVLPHIGILNTWICTIIICVSLWLRKQRQRFAQDQPNGYFETKVFELLLNHARSIIPMKERWERSRMRSMMSLLCQLVATLQFVSSAETEQCV